MLNEEKTTEKTNDLKLAINNYNLRKKQVSQPML